MLSSIIIRFLPPGLFPSSRPSMTSFRSPSCLRICPIHFFCLSLQVLINVLSSPTILNTSSIANSFSPTYLPHPSPHPHFKTFQSFDICSLQGPGARFIKNFFSVKMGFERQNGFSATKILLMGFSVKISVS